MKKTQEIKNIKEIIIKDEKIINFYEKNKQIDIVKLNLLYINLFEQLLESSVSFDSNNSSIVNTILSTLTNQTNDINNITTLLKYSSETYKTEMINIKDLYSLSINNIKSEIENIKTTVSNISSSLISKIYESKDNYIKELKETLKNVETESKQNISLILEKQNNILSEKLILTINEIVPKSQQNQYNDIINNFKKELDISITDPKLLIEKIENKYTILLNNIQDNMNNNIAQTENRLNTNINQIKDLSTKNTHIQENLNEELMKYINKHNNSSSKGAMGENLLYTILSDELPTAEIINTSNLTGRGDFVISRKDKCDILIETKEYSSNVKREEVDKFIRDISSNDCHGIFISQNSGIVNKENYQIDIHNNKILIYVHKMQYEQFKIGLAIKLIDLISEKITKNIDEKIVIPNDILKEINSEYQNMYLLKDKLISDLKEYTKKTLEKYELLNLSTLEKFLSKYYANTKKNTYICEYCKNYECNNLRSMARHKTNCKQKIHKQEQNENLDSEISNKSEKKNKINK
jgi:hypothetical protein